MWEKHPQQELHEAAIEKEDKAKLRYEICKSCDLLNQFKFCKSCGCFMPIKVRMNDVSCPERKW